MNVIHVSFHLDRARRDPDALLEAWPTLTGVAGAVARAGLGCTVLQASWTDATREVNGVTVQFVAERWPAVSLPGGRLWPRPPRRLLARAREMDTDLAHVHGLVFPRQTALLARALTGIPVLLQDHATRLPARWRRPAFRRAFRPIAGAAFAARAQADPFFAAGIFRPDLPIFQVMEGSTRFVPGDREAARAATGLHGDPCLLWVGRLDRNKDPLTVLEALSLAAPRLRDPQLWCCFASAPLLDAVGRRIAEDPVLRDRVHVLGARPHADLQLLYRAADLYVASSRFEGSGYAAIEALACGTPPVVTDIPSFRVITGEGTVGALAPPGDPRVLADILVAWGTGDRIRQRRAARAHFERVLSFDAIGQQLGAAYRALTAGR